MGRPALPRMLVAVITRLNTVTVYVSDQDRSLDFYVGKLGFEKRADRDMGPSGRWIEVSRLAPTPDWCWSAATHSTNRTGWAALPT